MDLIKMFFIDNQGLIITLLIISVMFGLLAGGTLRSRVETLEIKDNNKQINDQIVNHYIKEIKL